MRNHYEKPTTFFKVLFLLAFIILSSVTIAQNLLMPIPNGQVYDFSNCGSNSNVSLPISSNWLGSTNPFDEGEMCVNFFTYPEYLAENFMGQYPKYCEQVVTDNKGNLLFFIIDENIYNKNGDPFTNSLTQDPAKLHYIPSLQYELHRFQSKWNIGPEIVVVPVPNTCDNSFYLFYSIIEANGSSNLCSTTAGVGSGPYEDEIVFCKKLTYIDENTIELTAAQEISSTSDFLSTGSWYYYKRKPIKLGITEFRPEGKDYLLFVNTLNYLYVLRVTDDMNDLYVENAKVYNDSWNNWGSDPNWEPANEESNELEIIKHPQNDYYFVATSYHDDYLYLIGFPRNFNLIPGSVYGNTSTPLVNDLNTIMSQFPYGQRLKDTHCLTCDYIGLEFTNDANYLYITQENYEGIKCYDIVNETFRRMEVPGTNSFQYSFIEMGKDNNLYLGSYQGGTVEPSNLTQMPGKLAYISNPENIIIDPNDPSQIENTNLTITNIDIIGSTQTDMDERFLFPDQIDGYDMNTYYDYYNKIITYDEFPSILNSTENWSSGCANNPFNSIDGHVYINSDIVIPKGIQLTVQGMTFHLASDVKVIVENGDPSDNGAKLILDNALFTSLNNCGTEDFWSGIEVWGTTSENQYPVGDPTHQGYCELKNGATIENAECGIKNWKQDDYSKCGGVIVADNASFKNNTRSLFFAPYTNTSISNSNYIVDDLSTFTYCDFDVDDDYFEITGKHFMKHVVLWDVRGVTFQSCNFTNNQSNKVYAENENSNQAIFSLAAGFNVTGDCSSTPAAGYPCSDQDLTPTTFEGFNIAIRLETTPATGIANITQSQFNKNARAIQVEGMDNVVLNRNKFNVGECEINGLPGDDENLYGIKLFKGTGFMVEENELIGIENPTYSTVGIAPIHTNNVALNDNNQIYKNELEQLDWGFNAVGVNTSAYYEIGLQILCNEMDNNTKYDIDVVNKVGEASPNAGIREEQGEPTNPAANHFSYDPKPDNFQIRNLGDAPINYYYYNDPNDPTNPYVYTQYPEDVYEVNQIEETSANSCSSHIINGMHFELTSTKESELYTNFTNGKTSYWNLYYSYLQLIDGGNTPAVLQEIQNTWPQEAWDLRNDLMALAPYVSQDALMEAAMMDVLPDAMLLEICLANPDATRSQEFLDFLENDIPSPLPMYMINLIEDNWDAVTPLSILLRDMSAAAAKMDYNMNMLLINEKIKAEFDGSGLRQLLAQRGNITDNYRLAHSYMEANLFDSSEYVLDEIPLDFELDDQAIDEYDNFYLYHDLMKDLYITERSIFDLDSTEVLLLEQIADGQTGPSSVWAQNILCFVYGDCMEYPGNTSDTTQHKSAIVYQNPDQVINDAYTTIFVSPNPATVYAEFTWEILSFESKANLEIMDMNGMVIKTHEISNEIGAWVLDTRNLVSGTYIYTLKGNNKVLKSGKLTVQNN